MRIVVGVGAPADQISAIIASLDQQFVAAGIVEQPFLRENADFNIHRPGEISLQLADGAKAFQSDPRIDFDMGAHPRRALHDRFFQRAPPSRVNVLLGEGKLCGSDALDRFLQGAGAAAAAIGDA